MKYKHLNQYLILLSIVYNSYEQLIAIKNDELESNKNDLPLEGGIGEVNVIEDDENNTTPFIDRSSEEWVQEAVLDVAYYLRSHKFNDFDRRYHKELNIESSTLHKSSPSPPLRYLHWEVYRYCDMGFYDCLAYLQDTVLKADLIRSMDSSVIMNQKHWEYPRNAKSMKKVDEECVRLRELDWKNADPFKGPLERFQWRVSASYYMCYFTMQEVSPLIMFGERCDNYANCMQGNTVSNGDPRADDSKPFQCALYSFCPEVCCPSRKIKDRDECLDLNENPCFWHKDRSKRECVFNRELNRDMVAMALNEWNVTCQCEEGFEWESMFGMCVDIDECSTGKHTCNNVNEICINLKGHFGCVCAWGYINITGTCVPNHVLTNALASLHTLYHPPPANTPRPFSLVKSIFDKFILFPSKGKAKHDEEPPMLRNLSEIQIEFPSDD